MAVLKNNRTAAFRICKEERVIVISTVFYILITLLIFGSLVLIHELGHFLVARAFRVTVNEFSIGMGPKIVSRVAKKSGIRYSLRMLPIGGYVSMAGENEASDDVNAFSNKKVWQRILVVLAGPAMNILLGFLSMFLMVSLTVANGSPLASTTVAQFQDGAESSKYGLMIDDEILKVGNVYVHTGDEVVYEIMNNTKIINDRYATTDLLVMRDGQRVKLENVVFPILKDDQTGVVFGNYDFKFYGIQGDFGTLCKNAFWRSLSTVKMIWDSLIDLVTGRYGLNAMSGPVGITKQIGTAVKSGGTTLLYLFTVITMNLGVFNLIPFPALDGGQLLFLLIEGVRRKPLKQEVIGTINFVGISLLLLLMVFVTIKDVIGLF
ncbi:membrane-associated zinc metalloprotease [Clostridium sp. CAG:448]|nr:membrane-associated zinc metalloprotease [Clostridium sp. CAG:448]